MSDKELIRTLRKVHDADFTPGVYEHSIYGVAADRLEALLAENEAMKDREKAYKELKQALERKCTAMEAVVDHLREATKMVPKWVSVEEGLPHFNQPYIVTACDENAPAGEGIWYSTVVVVAEYYDGCWTWDENGTEYDLTGLVTHWMPLPKPPCGGC